jgi:hypothetical protein
MGQLDTPKLVKAGGALLSRYELFVWRLQLNPRLQGFAGIYFSTIRAVLESFFASASKGAASGAPTKRNYF